MAEVMGKCVATIERKGADILCMQREVQGKDAASRTLRCSAEEVQMEGEDVGCKHMTPLRRLPVRAVRTSGHAPNVLLT